MDPGPYSAQAVLQQIFQVQNGRTMSFWDLFGPSTKVKVEAYSKEVFSVSRMFLWFLAIPFHFLKNRSYLIMTLWFTLA